MAEVTVRLFVTENEKANRPLRDVPEYDLVMGLHRMNTERANCWGFPDTPTVNGVYGRDWIKRELKYRLAEQMAPEMMPLGLQIEVA